MWNNFEQSSIDDETISNEFASRGIFKISADDEVCSYPRVQASAQNQKLVIAIDKSLVLLENEMIAKCSFLNFNAVIDVIAISHSGNLIVCGLNDGEIHGIYIKGIPLFNLCIKLDDVQLKSRTFVGIQQIDNQFYLTCTNGSVYTLSEIDETPLNTNLNISISVNETIAFDESFIDSVTISNNMSSNRPLSEATSTLLILQYPRIAFGTGATANISMIYGTHNGLHFRNNNVPTVNIDVPETFCGIKHIYNLDNIILVLTDSGHLLEVCPFSKILINSEVNDDMIIDEMMIIECSNDIIELLVLTKVSENRRRQMKMISYPSFQSQSEFELNDHSWLVQQPKSSVNLYFLGGENVNNGNIPSVIEMKLVSETHPSERFKKLIAKGHFEEAEAFGTQFEMSLHPIFEARARHIIKDLCSLNENNIHYLNDRFDALVTQITQIENSNFFKNIRIISLPSRTMLKKFLNIILQHLDEEIDEYDVLEVIEQLHRLETLNIIDPYECNLNWQSFVYSPNLLKTITSLYKTDMPTASFIWKRHCSSMMPQLNEQELRKLLNLIPNKTDAFGIIQWLRQFVPTVGNTHPNLMPFIAEWSIQKTRSLQHAEHWPEIGLEFSTKVAQIFEEIQFLHSDVRRQHERNILKLQNIVNALQDLVVLKTSYNLTSTLDNYLQDSIEETALHILQRVHLDNLKSLINDFIYPIFQEKCKSPEMVIRQYISHLVVSRNSLSSWLARAVTCIQLLHNEDNRMECALLVLQSTPVPWPETVAPLIKLRYSTHPCAFKINTEYELQVIKIMKVKYGWPVESTSNKNLNLFMFRVVKMNLPDMLEDIRVLTKAAPDIAASANFNCCYQLVCRGKLEVAYEFWKQLQSENNETSIEIANFFADMLENYLIINDQNKIEELKQLIDFYKLISTHTVDKSTNKILTAIQNRFVLRFKFGLIVGNINDKVYEHRMELLDMGINNIIERSRGIANIRNFIMSQICELSLALNIKKMVGIIRICERIRYLPLTCIFAYDILELVDCTMENAEDFIGLALEILAQQITLAKSNNLPPISQIIGNDNDHLAFPLAYELLIRAFAFEQKLPEDILDFLKVMHILVNLYPVDAIKNHYNGNEKEIEECIIRAMGELKFFNCGSSHNLFVAGDDFNPEISKLQSMSVFDEISVQPQHSKKKTTIDQMTIVKFVSRTLLLILLETEHPNSLFKKLNNSLSKEIKSDIDGAREDFFVSLELMVKVKMHNVWYIMAQYLLYFQKQTKCKIINADFVSHQLRRVFRNVLTKKQINFIDLFVMLIADNHSTSLLENLSFDLKTDQQKVNYLTLSEMYYVYFKEKDHIRSIRTTRIKHFYYMEFCKKVPSVKGKFNAEIDNIEQLLEEFHIKKLDVLLLERMSRDFGLEYQQILLTQVFSILRAQELQYEIQVDTYGDEELMIISTVENIRNSCQPYINEIVNIELLASKLKQFISEINIYFYELYLCVIEILSYIKALPSEMLVWSNILHFLKHKMIHRRQHRPGQLETDIWQKSQCDIGVLPKIARYRLPFTAIVEHPLKDILDNEISVDNCESWFPLIQMHTVLKGSSESEKMCDYFCMSAVRNSISEYKSKNNADEWNIHPINNAFLKSVSRLVHHVNNTGKAFMILYFVSNYAPDGADQVEATYECYKYAVEHEMQLLDLKLQDHVFKIKRKYPIIKTQHLLYVHGLVEDKLMALVENPTELIVKMYHDGIMLKSNKLDINTLVKEIADLHQIDIDIIQFQLLQKWLSFSMESVDGTVMEETFAEDLNISENNGIGDIENSAENVIRANYILNSWPKERAIRFLVAHIFPSDGSVNTNKQLQMYECFSKLNDGSASFSNVLSQQQYITIKCVHELKKLGYNSSLEKFADTNKISILKTIWQRNAENPNTLQILANICLGFNIYLSKIWNGILKRMVMFNMEHELNALVDVLSCKPELLHTEGLAVAWEYVLKSPFKNANQTRSIKQEEQLHKSLFRLQSCPVLHKLNLFEFAEQCIRLDRPHMAAIIGALCHSNVDENGIRKLIENRKNDQMRKDISDLEDAGILPIIINIAFKEFDM